ncbi:MAG: hypothetical protein Q9207_003619 [Kuettlingeria erythrocarpa]
MADKPFDESLDDLERLVQTERTIRERNYTDVSYDIQKDVKDLIGNSIALDYEWAAAIISCTTVVYTSEGLRTGPKGRNKASSRLPYTFEYVAKTKAFKLHEENHMLYGTKESQEPPIVITWYDSLKVRLILLPKCQDSECHTFLDITSRISNITIRLFCILQEWGQLLFHVH